LDKKVNEDSTYPIPEGFRKQVEKIPVYSYKIPDCAKPLLKEGQVIATEVMDAILFEALGTHFLEPLISFDVKYKVKPSITRTSKPPAEALSYMKKVEKKIDLVNNAPKGTAFAQMSAADKRREALEVKPKINLGLKLQVMKQDLKNRPHYQEVAEVFEEIIQASLLGLTELPPRLNRAPGQVKNEAKELKA
jgi:hypothetical protein